MRRVDDIVYNANGMQLDLLMPDGESKATFIYFHGGGIVEGNRKDIGNFSEYLTQNGIAVASVEYRMYPVAQYPDFIEDCADSVLWIKNNAANYGLSDKIFVGGSSAGGYLSMMLCFCNKFFEKRGLSQSDIAGYIHDAGQPTAHFNVLKYSGVDSRRIIVDETAPLYYIGVAKEYPPMTFIVSDNDMQNRLEQTMLVLSTLKHFGYDQSKIEHCIMHGRHCEYLRLLDNDGKPVLGKFIKKFIEKYVL